GQQAHGEDGQQHGDSGQDPACRRPCPEGLEKERCPITDPTAPPGGGRSTVARDVHFGGVLSRPSNSDPNVHIDRSGTGVDPRSQTELLTSGSSVQLGTD